MEKFYVTDKGRALLAKLQAGGQPLTLLRWEIGSGVLPAESSPEQAVALLQRVATIPIERTVALEDACTVTGQLINTDLPAFRWEETGLFARDPDEGDILYGYTNQRGTGQMIEAGNIYYREAIFGFELVFSNAASVEASLAPTQLFLRVSDRGAAGGVASLDEGGKVPSEQLPEMDFIPTSEKGAANGVATLGGTKKIPVAQIPALSYDPAGSAAAVQGNLNTHTGDRSNPHGVTAAQAGADPKGSAAAVQGNLDAHTGNRSNPHGVTAAQAGADPKGSAAAVQQALNAHTGNRSNPHGVTAAQVGAIPTTEKGAAGGVATLDSTKKIPVAQLPTALTENLKEYVVTVNTGNWSGNATNGYTATITVASDVDLTNAIVLVTPEFSTTQSTRRNQALAIACVNQVEAASATAIKLLAFTRKPSYSFSLRLGVIARV